MKINFAQLPEMQKPAVDWISGLNIRPFAGTASAPVDSRGRARTGRHSKSLEDRAWEIYCAETAGSMHVADFWHELHERVQAIYLNKAEVQQC